ncbi:MAG: restriction endonuclease subunit S [Prevotella sp.]|nr:restriction endonuclease subunit S [Prevotella sp.]
MFARTGASVGKTYLYKKSDGILYYAGFLIKMNISEADSKFVFLQTLRKQYYDWINSESKRSGQPGINLQQLKTYKFLSSSFIEQQAISTFFQNLDNLITEQKNKLENLQKVKKSMLCKMFPKEGQKVPEIRFKGFEGDWGEKRFENLYEHHTIKNDGTFGLDKVISVASMYLKNEVSISDKGYLKTYNIFKLGDIAFEGNKSKHFAHGRFVENTIGRGIVSHVFEVFSPIMEQYDINFWKYLINNENVMGSILMRSTKASTMMTNLVVNDFLKEKILLPSYEEQKLIGGYLYKIDCLIFQENNFYKRISHIKQSLLSKMFV